VAFTDVIQTAAIVIGLLLVAILLGNKAGGVDVVFAHAYESGKLNLFPHLTAAAWMGAIGQFITMAFGSIPQQDVFQRVTSAKNEKTALIGTFGGGMFYFVFAFVPMFIAYSALIVEPALAESFDSEDTRVVQQILPSLVLKSTPIWCQILFFGQRADRKRVATVLEALQRPDDVVGIAFAAGARCHRGHADVGEFKPDHV
jgi:Na+/proline symporter